MTDRITTEQVLEWLEAGLAEGVDVEATEETGEDNADS